jgi:hypothetical protein
VERNEFSLQCVTVCVVVAGVEQVTNRCSTQYAVHCGLYGMPKRTYGAISRMRAAGLSARVAITKIVRVDSASENGQRITNADSLRRKCEGIATCFAARGLHETALPQDTHQLRHVWHGDALFAADLRYRSTPVRTTPCNLQETAQSVFLVRA